MIQLTADDPLYPLINYNRPSQYCKQHRDPRYPSGQK
jgi:hypothetical protein